jgi:Ran GTPase-activating protein (RanGAP) involved in mRNA processing and transport
MFRKVTYQKEYDDYDTSATNQIPLALLVREAVPLLVNLRWTGNLFQNPSDILGKSYAAVCKLRPAM